MARRTVQLVALLLAMLVPTIGALQPTPASAEMYDVNDIVTAMMSDLDAYYADWLGSDYRSPSGIFYYNTGSNPGPSANACGVVETDNASYCSADESIYMDYTLLEWELRNGGDYAVAFTLAHEWAHHVQNIYGLLGRHFSIEVELQADCLAGVHSRHLEMIGMLEAGDLEEGYEFAYFLGDPVGSDPWHDGAHGEGTLRMDWFLHGHNEFTWAACETYNA